MILHYLQFRLSRILSNLSENGSEFLGIDGSVVIRVEMAERILELSDLLLAQALCGHCALCLRVQAMMKIVISKNQNQDDDFYLKCHCFSCCCYQRSPTVHTNQVPM